MYCAISGEIPKEPVVVKSTGILFEKSLIEKAIKAEGKCPVTGVAVSEEDILLVKATKLNPSRNTGPTSVPGLLYALQQEWDEHVLESFSLKQQLEATRKELAHALYQHDAACRVISRLMRERDEAQQLLKQFQINGHSATISPSAPDAATDTEVMDLGEQNNGPVMELGVGETVLADLNAVCKTLSTGRKGRKVSEHLLSKESMATLQETSVFFPHKQGQILSLAVSNSDASTTILTGGSDKSMILMGVDGKINCKVNGHKGKVTHVAFSPNHGSSLLFSAGDENSVKVWGANEAGGFSEKWNFTKYNASVAGMTVHPSANYIVTVSDNHEWQFLDVSREGLLKVVGAKEQDIRFQSCSFHPDGLILGTGTSNGAFKIWDIREQKNVINLTGHTGSIKSISFSENGYLVATGAANGVVNVWDLRKQTCTKSIEVGTSAVNAVAFDHSGVYLGIAGGGDNGRQVQVKVVKEWVASALLSNVHSDDITGVAWGNNATSLITTSLDRTVKVYSAKN